MSLILKIPILRRKLFLSASVIVLTAALAGCSGRGGGGASSSSSSTSPPVTTDPDPVTLNPLSETSIVTAFTAQHEQAATAIAASQEFAAQTPDSTPVQPGAEETLQQNLAQTWQDTSNSFAAIGLEYALALGFDGTGETIAIIDDAAHTDHVVFTGKNIETTYAPSRFITDHGTQVASIIAGAQNTNSSGGTIGSNGLGPDGIMGVASGTNLHLSDRRDVANLHTHVFDAAAKQAIFLNHSFGSEDYASVSARDHDLFGPDLLAAYVEFLKTGIVGYELSNGQDDTSASAAAAAPLLYKELNADDTKGRWVAVGNATAFTTDGTEPVAGNIDGLTRYSSGCFETAAWCLFADGNVIAATAHTDNGVLKDDGYAAASGSSFALSQVSGAIAILAQAFPDLPPNELLDRLLASANNSFFANQGVFFDRRNNGDVVDEFFNTYVEFCYKDGGCADDDRIIAHRYNQEFGHGFLDIKAALLPIGEVCIYTGTFIDCNGNPIIGTPFSVPTATARAMNRSLSNQRLAVFDDLGTPFFIPASTLIAAKETSEAFDETLARFAAAGRVPGSDRNDGENGWFSLAARNAPLGTLREGFLYSPDTSSFSPQTSFMLHSGSLSWMAKGLGFVPMADEAFSDGISILPNGSDALAYGMTLHTHDGGGVGAFAFVEQAGNDFNSVGFAFNAASTLPDGGFGSFGLVMKSEPSQFMGLSTAAAVEDDFAALSAALNLSYRQRLDDDLIPDFKGSAHFFATLEAGIARADGASVISHFDQSAFSGFAVGLSFEDVLSDQDTLTLTLRQPTRLESGSANFRLPTGRNKDRSVNFTTIAADLEPEARQLDFGASYSWTTGSATQFKIGGTWSLNAYHVRDRSEGNFMAAVSRRF